MQRTVYLNERNLIKHMSKKCKSDYEKSVTAMAIHLMFNSFYGNCRVPVTTLPIQITLPVSTK